MTDRWKTIAATFGAAVPLAFTALISPLPAVLWNTTASAPIGFYRVRPVGRLDVGDLVIAGPPEPLATWLDDAGYLPRGVPLLKGVAAVAGQRVCRTGDIVTVDGRPTARARKRDRLGRSLPTWLGCRRLAVGEVFLLNPAAPDSFDGRYFGPTEVGDVLGRATLLWTWKER
ncbi:S26 family signal peptidase [Caulobacter sp. KR2-114]|jgi:conjugative transfer signal peptidase TraF|uniref:S26 family signal peptidase n=1 Tax=Caulobacter sp. KR2-114 TaxID=3400912 RepID=UPI003C0663D1